MSRTAREEFLYLLGDQDAEYIDNFLDLYAHELAGKIREVRDDYDGSSHNSIWDAIDYIANLIDPEVE